MNIGAVLGLLPITGVPLPLVSAGVSSLLVTMAALGMLMSFARAEPGAAPGTRRCWPGAPRRLARLGSGADLTAPACPRAGSRAGSARQAEPRAGGPGAESGLGPGGGR